MGADVMMGTDPECRRWIKKYREPAPEGESRGARGDRERRRRA
jgi:5-methyltetrahydrofolate--homocysteine methyltransferase